MWVRKLKNNLSGRDPTIYKKGVYRQAKVLFKQGFAIKAFERIREAFHIDSILKHFEPERFAKKPSEVSKPGHSLLT
jgi:hypothetical protein